MTHRVEGEIIQKPYFYKIYVMRLEVEMFFPNYMILVGAVNYMKCKLANVFGIMRNEEPTKGPTEQGTVSLVLT